MEQGFVSAEEAKRRTNKEALKNKEQLESEDENWLKLDMALAVSRGEFEVTYKLKHPQKFESLWKKLDALKYQLELVEVSGKPDSIIVRWS